MKVGTPVKEPQPGDIVVFWRGKEKGWQGHVGFFIKADKEKNLIYVFGGNQDGAICLNRFLLKKYLVIDVSLCEKFLLQRVTNYKRNKYIA